MTIEYTQNEINKITTFAARYGMSARRLGKTLPLWGETPSNLCNEIFLHEPNKEKHMYDLKITRPLMVGNVDILTARDFELAGIIREAQAVIEANKDMSELSQHYRDMDVEAQEVIDLCVEQLDKRIAVKSTPTE